MAESTGTQNPILPRPRLKRGGTLREIIDILILIGAIYALVNLVTVRFIVHGPSMESTFYEDDYLIVSRLSYLLDEPDYGDVVVFHFPGDTDQDYIKRVVGLPGDQVEIRDTFVYVNGQVIDEPYINEPCTLANCRDNVWILNDDEYFVMGDNRNHSSDSRRFSQPVKKEHIVGEVVLRYWPPASWGVIGKINYPGE